MATSHTTAAAPTPLAATKIPTQTSRVVVRLLMTCPPRAGARQLSPSVLVDADQVKDPTARVEQTFYDARVGMNPSRFDRWPKPERIRHVWVYGPTRADRPYQGLVLEWKREGRDWAARVAWVIDRDDSRAGEPPYVVAWVPRRLLGPVRSDPNETGPHRSRR